MCRKDAAPMSWQCLGQEGMDAILLIADNDVHVVSCDFPCRVDPEQRLQQTTVDTIATTEAYHL